MLHELLLALHGISGGIFVQSNKKTDEDDDLGLEKHLIPIANNLPFVPQGELVLHAELLKLGTYYNYLQEFIERFSESYHGLYLSAFTFGIDDSLKEYRTDLCTLETELLMDADLGVSHVSYRLHPYKILLPVLVKVTKKVENMVTNPHTTGIRSSCRLLDTILSAAPPGLPGPRSTIQKLITHVIQVFFRQLSSWLVYGILHDPYSEFFIKLANSTSVSIHPNSPDLQHSDVSTKDVSILTRPTFVIDNNNLPSFLPTSFAQRVLATGEAVYSATNDPSEASFLLELERTYCPRFAELSNYFEENSDEIKSTGKTFSNLVDFNKIHSLVCDIQGVVSYHTWCSLMKEHKLLQYLRLVKDVLLLGRGELFLAFLDNLNILNYLSSSSNSDYGINCVTRRSVLDRPPSKSESEIQALEYDVHEAFLGAARSLGMDDEELDAKFKFSIQLKTTQSHEISETTTVWDCLHLCILPPPALECLFSSNVCHAYDRLFQFLFSIRRAQLKLQQFWADQTLLWRRTFSRNQLNSDYQGEMSSNGDFTKLQSCIVRRLLVRSHMAFIIENLQYYLQVDVIEAQFSHLIHRIHSDQETQLIQIAHEAYLAGLQAQALLFMPNIKLCISQLLNYCCQFVQLSNDQNGVIVDADYLNTDECHMHKLLNDEQEIIRKFYTQAKLLYDLLNISCSTGAKSSVGISSGYTVSGHRENPVSLSSNNATTTGHHYSGTTDLNQFLLRLDFNHFYSDSPENLI
ncbi:Gamma-tubulin complex component 4 [Schistosoma japonicum]|uniref:Gamma-tubulin complex component n=1 Tax=Schistosoma japonicum TaxID=6182 RepID=A0A4Z2DS52_SCHJA|nr:Gamma-tubulin complex component 4 [Schistosoma japonicum]KAH8863535.1 Gamma-tubulin complex component 4 [Schistosoma japonicum]KAH8863537.1 Gamma-tubulin complex component 4 [Schistosoma japonicum]TNN19289.1 Gamma-tubulin complex component 4 [Schistosoma japonicum]